MLHLRIVPPPGITNLGAWLEQTSNELEQLQLQASNARAKVRAPVKGAMAVQAERWFHKPRTGAKLFELAPARRLAEESRRERSGQGLGDKGTETFSKIRASHIQIPSGLRRAIFVSVEIDHDFETVSPRPKDWKYEVWRVTHSRIVYPLDGSVMHLEQGEMTSFRDAWYVTHLR